MISYALAGKTTLVTGGASGIGLASAFQLGRTAVAVNFLADDARDRESVSRLKTQGIKAIEAPGNSWRWRGPRPHGGEGDRRPTLAASTCSLPRRAIRPSSTITTHASGLKHSVDQSPYCSAPASLQWKPSTVSRVPGRKPSSVGEFLRGASAARLCRGAEPDCGAIFRRRAPRALC